MKKIWVFLLTIFLVAVYCMPVQADSGLLPKNSTQFGVIMPDIRFAINREADKVETGNDGEKLLFYSFTAEEYQTFGRYAYIKGLKLRDKTYRDGTLTAQLEKDESVVIFEYNYSKQSASLFYPTGVRKEKEKGKVILLSSILPSVERTFAAKPMPSLRDVLERAPDSETKNKDGSVDLIWQGVTDDDYETFSKYLKDVNAELLDYRMYGSVFIAIIGRDERTITFSYDSQDYSAKITYPADTYDERQAEAHYRAAEEYILQEQYVKACDELYMIKHLLFYKDVNNLLADNYQIALALRESGEYEDAVAVFTALRDYKDAEEQKKETQYQIALTLYGSGKYNEASEIFEVLGDYSDSEAKITECQKNMPKATVTIMVYMCGSDLESKSGMATMDLQEMVAANIGDHVNLIILTGGSTKWHNSQISNESHQLWQIRNGELHCLSNNEGSASMTSPATLSAFIGKTVKSFPADRYGLVLWGHGSGTVNGYGYDEQNPDSNSMSLADIHQALIDGGIHFDFIGFDASLMATVETALMLNEHADYMIASQEIETSNGWYYTDWLNLVNSDSSVDTMTLCKKIVNGSMKTNAPQVIGQNVTFSVIDLTELSRSVPDKLDAFARSISSMIMSKNYRIVSNVRGRVREFAQSKKLDLVDLADLALCMGTKEGEELAEAISRAVCYNCTSPYITNAYGLSICFPYQRLSNVDKVIGVYNQIGMSDDYIRCFSQFAKMEMSGQAVSGGALNNPYLSLTGSSSDSTGGYGSSDVRSVLLGGIMSGDFGRFPGLNNENTAFLQNDVMSQEEVVTYLSDNALNSEALVFTDTNVGKTMILPVDQWALVQDVQLNMFIEHNGSYIDLGMDSLYDADESGNLVAYAEKTWIAINGTPVPYYQLAVDDAGHFGGYVPAMLDGDRVQLLITFDENGTGELIGFRFDYQDGETDAVSKTISDLPVGSAIQLLCDRYLYDGTYEADYKWGSPITVTENMLKVSDVLLDYYTVRRSYRLTDIYNQNYWTESY